MTDMASFDLPAFPMIGTSTIPCRMAQARLTEQ